MPAYITGLGVCLPNKPVPSNRIESVLGKIAEQPSKLKDVILARNGIKWRYYAIDPETGKPTHTNASLTAEAVRALARDAGFSAEKLEVLSCGTSSADQFIPNHACMVHGLLGGDPCEVVSPAGVCCSGMAAMKYGYWSVLTGSTKSAVVTGSELASSALAASQFKSRVEATDADNPYIGFNQEFLRFMLSDGAGAARIEDRPRESGPSLRIDWIDMVSYANQSEVCMYAGALKREDGVFEGWRRGGKPLGEAVEQGYFNLSQDVDVLMKHVVPLAGAAFRQVRERRNLRGEEIDWVLPHLSSMFFEQPIREAAAGEGFQVPQERWFTNLSYKGNTGSAAIYIILDELLRSGRIKPGQRVLCAVPESARFSFAFMHLTAE